MTNNITPSRYAKKAFIIFGIIIFTLIFVDVFINIVKKNGCPFSTTFILAIILIPSLCTFTYIPFLGARKIVYDPDMGKIAYYWITVPASLLSVISSAIIGWLFVFMETTVSQCAGVLFLFFGGWIILPFWFIFLNIIGTIELYIIKKKILRNSAS